MRTRWFNKLLEDIKQERPDKELKKKDCGRKGDGRLLVLCI
jgi:hypothetical protein